MANAYGMLDVTPPFQLDRPAWLPEALAPAHAPVPAGSSGSELLPTPEDLPDPRVVEPAGALA